MHSFSAKYFNAIVSLVILFILALSLVFILSVINSITYVLDPNAAIEVDLSYNARAQKPLTIAHTSLKVARISRDLAPYAPSSNETTYVLEVVDGQNNTLAKSPITIPHVD